MSPDSAPTLAGGVCDDPGRARCGGAAGPVPRAARGGPPSAPPARLQRCADAAGADLFGLRRRRGHLNVVDDLGADDVARRACGLQAGPDSRRLGADLQRMHEAALEGLRQCARLVSRQLVQECVQRRGYMPVFGDSTGIQVESQLCENADRGCHGEQQSWLHSVCVGAAWVSARLNAGGTDVKGGGGGSSWTRMRHPG